MARTFNRLNDRQAKSKGLKPGLHADGGNLFLQVTASGARSWVFRFKRNGKARDMGLGSLTAVSLAEARQKAEAGRKVLEAGRDPIEEKARQRSQDALERANGKTFKEAAAEYIAAHEATWRNSKHRQQWSNTIESYVNPLLGDLAVADIGPADVRAVIEPLWRTKGETARRLLGRIRAIIDAARADDDVAWSNPAHWARHKSKLGPRPQKTVHHPALPWKQVPAFLARLRAREGITAQALEFTILTAVRTNETIGATFDEFDLANRTWVIPPGRMKADAEHRVPLCGRAVAIVKDMQKHRLNAFVFPGMKRDSGLSDMAMLMMLRDLHAGITVHGFRSSFRDWAGEMTNHPHDVCEAALGHIRERKVHGAYQRGDLFQKRRKLMEDWARFCEPSSAMKVGHVVARQKSPSDT